MRTGSPVGGGPVWCSVVWFAIKFNTLGGAGWIGTNNRIASMPGLGKTNAGQRTAGGGKKGFETNNITDFFTVTNTAETMTNHLDICSATNQPARCRPYEVGAMMRFDKRGRKDRMATK